jgi:hypothetical protein
MLVTLKLNDKLYDSKNLYSTYLKLTCLKEKISQEYKIEQRI